MKYEKLIYAGEAEKEECAETGLIFLFSESRRYLFRTQLICTVYKYDVHKTC